MLNIFKKAKKLTSLLSSVIYRQGLYQGVAAAIEHKAIISQLDITTCVDVGANIGQFSLLIRNEHPKAKIIAFEPLAKPASTYQKLFFDDSQVKFHQVALGSRSETIDMHVSNSIDSSSLLPISKLQSEQFPGTEEIGIERVQVTPMINVISEDQLNKPALLKIDVQGFELEVLKSAKELLSKFQWIYVEASFLPLYETQPLVHELISYLYEKQFYLVGIYNPHYDSSGKAIQADFLFKLINY